MMADAVYYLPLVVLGAAIGGYFGLRRWGKRIDSAWERAEARRVRGTPAE